MTQVVTYSVYLVLSIALTVWVGRTLHTNGVIFGLGGSDQAQPSSYLSIGLQLCGFRPESVQKLVKCWNIFIYVMESLAFYIFFFVLTHVFIVFLEYKNL